MKLLKKLLKNPLKEPFNENLTQIRNRPDYKSLKKLLEKPRKTDYTKRDIEELVYGINEEGKIDRLKINSIGWEFIKGICNDKGYEEYIKNNPRSKGNPCKKNPDPNSEMISARYLEVKNKWF